MAKVLRVISKLHIGLVLFMFLQISMIVHMSSGDTQLLTEYLVIYVVSTLVALSPIGEFVLCMQAGATAPLRMDMRERLEPMMNSIMSRIEEKKGINAMNLQLRFIDDPMPVALAIGRHTIAVSQGFMDMSYHEMEGILANEIAHLALRHNVVMMIAGCANPLILLYWGIIQISKWVLVAVFSILTIFSSNRSTQLISVLSSAIISAAIWLWTFLCTIFLAFESRQNVYDADLYTAELGYGYELASALESVGAMNIKGGFLRALQMTHPSVNARITRLQRAGIAYRSY